MDANKLSRYSYGFYIEDNCSMSPKKLLYDKRLPIYQQLREEMLGKISHQEWLHGEVIPAEIELAEEYGISIGTVRKAVDTLVADGFLERSQGRGTFVRRPSFNSSFFRFFRHMSTDGQRRVPESKILSCKLAKLPKSVAILLEQEGVDQAIFIKRERKIDRVLIVTEEIWLPKDLFAPLLKIKIEDFGNLLYPFYEESCGQLVASAQEKLTVKTSNEKMARSLNIEIGEPVVIIERLALGYDRRPLEWRCSYGAGNKFCYQVEIN